MEYMCMYVFRVAQFQKGAFYYMWPLMWQLCALFH